MKTIKVAYTDWWDGFNPEKYIYHEILSRYYNLEISENPDYVFCSLYSFECLKFENAVRIFTTGDNITPDFNLYDYAIAFDYISFGDRYLRMPNYIMNPKYRNDVDLMLHKHENVDDALADRNFCSWVCSNGNGNEIRERLYKKISQYRQVDSGGRFLNNIGKPDGVDSKIDFQKGYKFSLALQDSQNPGYLDEKLIQCFSSQTVPIFWGDASVADFFNMNSMINVHDFKSDNELIDEIIRVDSNKKIYLEKLRTPALKNPQYISESYDKLEAFLLHIIEQPIENAKRRTPSVWYDRIRDLCQQKTDVKKRAPGDKLFRWLKGK